MMTWKKRYKYLQEYMKAHINLLNSLEVMQKREDKEEGELKICTLRDVTSAQIITTKEMLRASEGIAKKS